MPSYKTAFGSYLKQEDLQGRTPTVVISQVGFEDVKDTDSGRTEKKLVMHFSGKDKALILNRTNCEALEAITGTDDFAGWVGHSVVLFTDPTVKFGGKTVGGLRIRARTAPQFIAPPPPMPQLVAPPPVAYERVPGEDDNGGPITVDDIPF